jgi:response regulator RpfG family c-di-GMP phosphodiesterase
MKYKILAVDDEAANVRMLERVFRGQFDVVTALSGPEALDLLTLHDIALIISDQRMPEMTGVEFLKRAAEMRPRCVRFILTGYTDANDLADALNSNVIYKYITKPWIAEDLLQTVKQGLAHYETIKGNHLLSLENHRLNERLNATGESFLRVFTEMLSLMSEDAKDTLEAGAGKQFDPRIASLFSGMRAESQVPDIDVESLPLIS